MYREKPDSTRKFILLPKTNASYLLMLVDEDGTHEMENWRRRCKMMVYCLQKERIAEVE